VIDLLFVIDNSATMAAKQAMVIQRLTTVIEELQTFYGGLPNMHIGIVSTDLGAGGGEAGGDCAVPLGDRGLLWGNDPTPGARATVAGETSQGCGLATGARWIETQRCPDGDRSVVNYKGELADVFSCMVRAMGTHGCGYSQALQATRLALDPQPGINDANRGFLRPNAQLAIIIVSDKDDCSASADATLNDGFFTQRNPDNPVLRCAVRGHVCGGQAIPNDDPQTGYDGTQGAFAFRLDACAAKEPTNPPDPHWLSLLSVKDVVDDIRRLKDGRDFAATGIFGWPPLPDSRPSYRIDRTTEQDPWGLSPVCTIPKIEGEGGNVYPALRLRAFLDAASDARAEWAPRSMCSDHWEWVAWIAQWRHFMGSACVWYPLIDRDPNTPEVQPDCRISMTVAADGSGGCGGEPSHVVPIPECADVVTGLPVNPDAPRPQLEDIPADQRPCWYLMHDDNPDTGCPNAFDHQKLALLFKPGQVTPPGATWTITCRTSAYPPVDGHLAE
jgi:hypothetical protein